MTRVGSTTMKPVNIFLCTILAGLFLAYDLWLIGSGLFPVAMLGIAAWVALVLAVGAHAARRRQTVATPGG